MSNTTTIIGNLVADVQLAYTKSGAAVANFTVADQHRSFDKQAQKWVDGDTTFVKCSVWRDAAEFAAESLSKGSRVIVTGKLRQRSWESQSGEKRSAIELEVEEVGPSLRYAKATVQKAVRATLSQSDDPWGSAPADFTPAAGTPESEAPF